MREWVIKKSINDYNTYVLKHITSKIFIINWFQEVKINKADVYLYDRGRLSAYYSNESLPKYIIKELEKLPHRNG